MPIVRDKLWMWGHEAGAHNAAYKIPGVSRMTPMEAAFYMNVPNLIMVRYDDRPAPPFDQYARAMRPLRQVVWSLVGAAGKTDADERNAVLDLAARTQNITGVMMDDYFSANAGKTAMSVDELRDLRGRIRAAAAEPLDLWVVLYDHQLDLPAIRQHLDLCDKITFWTWKATDLEALERNFDRFESIAPPRAGKLLGLYMWDYGNDLPMPLAVMQRQCEIGLRWLRERRVEGLILLASCICDLDIEAVEWARQWIATIGGRSIE